MNTQQVIDYANSLPIDMRIELVEKLQNTITPANAEVEQAWLLEAERRMKQIHQGEAQLLDGEKFMSNLMNKYSV